MLFNAEIAFIPFQFNLQHSKITLEIVKWPSFQNHFPIDTNETMFSLMLALQPVHQIANDAPGHITHFQHKQRPVLIKHLMQ